MLTIHDDISLHELVFLKAHKKKKESKSGFFLRRGERRRICKKKKRNFDVQKKQPI